jgi:hypothetical protein
MLETMPDAPAAPATPASPVINRPVINRPAAPATAPAQSSAQSPVGATIVTRDPVSQAGSGAATGATPDTPPGSPPRARTRVKTTLLGFEHSNGQIADVQSPADGAASGTASQQPAATAQHSGETEATSIAMYPAGWLVIVDGPGLGAGLPVYAGVSQIGRGGDQTVQLNFGDMGISRQHHAAVAYDPEARCFYLGHGGKSNLVRRNDMPVLTTERLENGDEIRISETTLRFLSLCGPDFCWSDT